jgi:hypothetical protein
MKWRVKHKTRFKLNPLSPAYASLAADARAAGCRAFIGVFLPSCKYEVVAVQSLRWWRRGESQYYGLLRTLKLLILRHAQNARNAQTASRRYTAGTRSRDRAETRGLASPVVRRQTRTPTRPRTRVVPSFLSTKTAKVECQL